MDPTKPHGFFLASLLVLVLLGDLTEACTCKPPNLQAACCHSPVVMSVKFMSISRDSDLDPYLQQNIYRIIPTQVYKGPKKLILQESLYTPSSDAYCGYKHQGPLKGEEYIFSGLVFEDHVSISRCSFAKPRNQLTSAEKKILNHGGAEICSCPY